MNMESLPLWSGNADAQVAPVQADECLHGLRPYQIESIQRLRDGIRNGLKNQILCSPTGSGKSVMAIHLLREAANKESRCVFVAERITLIDQFSVMLDAAGLPHGVHQGDHWRREPGQRIQVASAQTLHRRGWPPADLIIIDEAHVSHKNTLDRISRRDCITIGLTATPFSKGMGKFYDGIVNVTTTDTLTEEGFLVRANIFAPAEPDMEGVKVIAGEWEERETSKRATRIVGDVVREYLNHGEGAKFIAFGVDVNHCEALCAQFLGAGIMCALHVYSTPDTERQANMKEFRKPDSTIRGLISVSALSRGLDVPDVGCIIGCRPLRKSFAEFIQVLGRGLRPFPGKDHCQVLDLAGNTMRFAQQMYDFFANGWHELDDGSKQEKKKPEPKTESACKCPQCFHVHKKMPMCPACGYQYPRKATVHHVPGELVGVPGPVKASTEEKSAFYAMLKWHVRDRGYKPGWAYFKFKEKFGMEPRPYEHVEPAEPDAKMRSWIRSRQIAHSHAKKKDDLLTPPEAVQFFEALKAQLHSHES